jgi:hypothetical protein
MHKQAQPSDLGAAASGDALTTPRVSGELLKAGGPPAETPLPSSGTHPASAPEAEAASEPSDTLLSAGKPADRLELLLEDRLAVVDERLHELDARLSVLEQKKTSSAPEPRQRPWLWIAFLVALVVVFQMLQRMR